MLDIFGNKDHEFLLVEMLVASLVESEELFFFYPFLFGLSDAHFPITVGIALLELGVRVTVLWLCLGPISGCGSGAFAFDLLLDKSFALRIVELNRMPRFKFPTRKLTVLQQRGVIHSVRVRVQTLGLQCAA